MYHLARNASFALIQKVMFQMLSKFPDALVFQMLSMLQMLSGYVVFSKLCERCYVTNFSRTIAECNFPIMHSKPVCSCEPDG
jgi:hypothetical protein